MTDDSDEGRARAMFDPVDRQFLRGEKEYPTDQGTYDRRRTIRQRLQDGIIDFSVAQQNLSGWNWPKFIDQDRQEEMNLKSGMVSAIGLFIEIHHAKGWDFSTTLRDGLEAAHTYGPQRQMPSRIVEGVEYQTQTREREKHRDIQDRIQQKMEEGEELTDHEVRVAVELGEDSVIPNLQRYMRERQKEKRDQEVLDSVEEEIEIFGNPESDNEK